MVALDKGRLYRFTELDNGERTQRFNMYATYACNSEERKVRTEGLLPPGMILIMNNLLNLDWPLSYQIPKESLYSRKVHGYLIIRGRCWR